MLMPIKTKEETELEHCLIMQLFCLSTRKINEKMALYGLCDWVGEEVLLRLEGKNEN